MNANVNALAGRGDTIFVCSYWNGIYRSTDNGNSFTSVNSDKTHGRRFTSVAINGDYVFAGSEDGMLRSKIDEINWTEVNGITDTNIQLMVASSNGNIFATTQNSGIFRSNDNGDNWVPVNNGYGRELSGSISADRSVVDISVRGNTLLAGGNYSGIFKSADNGDTWTNVKSDINIRALAVNNNFFIASTVDSRLIKSTDNGLKWTDIFPSHISIPSGVIGSIKIIDNVIFLGTSGGTLFSLDSGSTWSRIDSAFCQIYTINNYYFISGSGLKRGSIAEITGISNHQLHQAAKNNVALSVHAPSIFNPEASIEFTLFHSDRVTIAIYDLYGRKIATLVDRILGSGSHIYHLDSHTLADGFYMIRMQFGTNTSVVRLPHYR
jgi:photosystem II stability/assembly factor-like uncharacterized protein